MRKYSSFKIIIFIFLGIFLFPAAVLAHQPRIVETNITNVPAPEISKAYYGALQGSPSIFRIESPTEFKLYANILVPDIAGQKRDVSAVILRGGDTEYPIAVLDGINFTWQQFFEEYGHDNYLKGPEFTQVVPAGTYEIRIWSTNNDSKYSLAIGDIESFDLKEGLNAIYLVPQIKRDFFNGSPADFILSPFGYGYIIFVFIAAFLFGFIYRKLMETMASRSPRGLHRNIGTNDRMIRAILAVILFVWAITTTWNPLLLFLSGFCLFEAIFRWCGFYAVLGKNTCPGI